MLRRLKDSLVIYAKFEGHVYEYKICGYNFDLSVKMPLIASTLHLKIFIAPQFTKKLKQGKHYLIGFIRMMRRQNWVDLEQSMFHMNGVQHK